MGNVQASSNLPPMPPNMTPVPPPSTQPKLPPEERIENPGSVEELHKKCKGRYMSILCRLCVFLSCSYVVNYSRIVSNDI